MNNTSQTNKMEVDSEKQKHKRFDRKQLNLDQVNLVRRHSKPLSKHEQARSIANDRMRDLENKILKSVEMISSKNISYGNMELLQTELVQNVNTTRSFVQQAIESFDNTSEALIKRFNSSVSQLTNSKIVDVSGYTLESRKDLTTQSSTQSSKE